MAFYYLCILIFGMIVGSFLNICIYRIPKGKSIVTPPSHCTKCGKRLKALDLIPVFSFLFLKGRCRYCEARIPVRYLFVESTTAVVFLLIFYRYGLTIEFLAMAYLMSILIIVFFIDIKHRIIPNELVVAGLIGAVPIIAYNIFKPVKIYEDDRWWSPLLGILPGCGFLFLIAVIGFIIYKTDDAMGMGDVKIFAPIGIFLGWKLCIIALVISILLGGVLGLVLIIAKVKERRDTIPFGPFIVIGTFVTIMWGHSILDWYIGRLG